MPVNIMDLLVTEVVVLNDGDCTCVIMYVIMRVIMSALVVIQALIYIICDAENFFHVCVCVSLSVCV